MNDPSAEVKASSPIRTSLYEREGSMRGRLKRPSLRREDELFPATFKAISKHFGIPVPNGLRHQPSDISHPVSMIDESRSDNSDLCHEMLTTFGFTRDQMHRVAERFRLGRSKSGKAIYWMIDDIGRCLDGHIGCTSHDADTWVSTLLMRRYPAAAPYLRVNRCFFGLHQISLNGSKPIGLVESERSAVLLSELCPELLWLAYSYTTNCTIDNFEPLQGRKITLYPRTDPSKDYYVSFLELADQVKCAYKSIDISVSRFLEDNTTDAQKQRDIDLLEFMLEK